MNKNDVDNADEALQKLANSINDAEKGADVVVVVKPHQAEALVAVAEFWHNMSGFVKIAGSIGSTFKWVVAMGAAWAAFKLGFFDWLSKGLSK